MMNHMMRALGIEPASGATATMCADLSTQAANRTQTAIADAVDLARLAGVPQSQRASVMLSISASAATAAIGAMAAMYGAALGFSEEESSSPRMRRIVAKALLRKLEAQQ